MIRLSRALDGAVLDDLTSLECIRRTPERVAAAAAASQNGSKRDFQLQRASSTPVNDCGSGCSEEEHQMNRRSEFIILEGNPNNE